MTTSLSCKDKEASGGLFDQCSVIATRKVMDGDTLIACDVAAVKESFLLPLSQLVDSFEIVRLENIDEALVNGGHITLSENYIGIRNYESGSYKLFNRQGKFIHTIVG